jgi:hypothetical protein
VRQFTSALDRDGAGLDNDAIDGQLHRMANVNVELRSKITSAIENYLDVLQGKRGPKLSELAKALDRLVTTYHQTPAVGPDTAEGSAAPRIDERPIIDAATAAFPDLGWYALVDPEDGQDQRIGMSIAVGDLTEIASDLHEVLWLFENASHNDAVWQFRWGYQSHWGRHLHEIRPYLHGLAAW